MVPKTSLFTMVRGMQNPWSFTDVCFDARLKEIHFNVCLEPGRRVACLPCGASDQPIHDTHPQNWEHLLFFAHKAFIHTSVLRVVCSHCGKTGQVPTHWVPSGSGFSQLLDPFVIALVREV